MAGFIVAFALRARLVLGVSLAGFDKVYSVSGQRVLGSISRISPVKRVLFREL
jgi:hypothetical protein